MCLKRIRVFGAIYPICGIFLLVIANFFFLCSLDCPAYSAPYGSSGGVTNEGDTDVNMLITDLQGDYQWEFLAAGTSLDFPENTFKVAFYESAIAPAVTGERIRLAVILPDGRRKEVVTLREEVFLTEGIINYAKA